VYKKRIEKMRSSSEHWWWYLCEEWKRFLV